MAFYRTFYLLSDPFSGEPKIVGQTENQVQEALQRLSSIALRNKTKTAIDEWVLELMNKNRVPHVTNLGQHKFISEFAVNNKLKEFEERYFPPDELEKEIDEAIEEITTEVTEFPEESKMPLSLELHKHVASLDKEGGKEAPKKTVKKPVTKKKPKRKYTKKKK